MKKRKFLSLLALIILWSALAMNAFAETTTADDIPVIQKWNISLDDKIGVNFYVNASQTTAKQTKVRATVAGQTQTYDLSGMTPDSDGLYQVSVDLAAAQMTEEISLQLVVDGTEYEPVSYSIREYALRILTGSYSEQAKTMVKHMLDYGAAAQAYFGIKTDQLANNGYVLDYTADYPTQPPELTIDGQISGVQFCGASLVMESKVAVRYYFLADSTQDVTFTVGGTAYTAVEQNDGLFYVEVPGILPQDYDKAVVLTGQKDQEMLQITYSPLTYFVRMNEKGQQNTKALVNAMYGYYEAAKAYGSRNIFEVVKGDWDLSDQNDGSITITNQKNGTAVITRAGNYNEISVKVKDHTPSKNADGSLKTGNFSVQLYFIFDDGKQYQVRMHNTDADGNYKLQHMGEANSLTGWKWQADLTTAQKAKLLDGDGVEFKVKLVGANAELWVDGSKMKTYSLGSAYDGKMAQIKLCMNGNAGVQNMQIPYSLAMVEDSAAIELPALTNGTVTADKIGCKLGDTVTLTVTPEEGYSQKLYINGEPLLLDWKTNTCSFVVTETVYSITGSFIPSLDAVAKDANRWDTANQAHGIFNAYYPDDDDAWLLEINDEYRSVSVKAKNPLAGADGQGGEGFAVNLGIGLSNGKQYIFRVIREKGKYYHQRFGINGSDWTKKELDAAAIAAICGEGVDFTLEHTTADTLTLSVNGVVYDTYTMEGAGEGTWVTKVIIGHYGLKGEKVAIPYSLKKASDYGEIQFNSSDLSKYVIVYDDSNYDYATYAKQLKNQISTQYGVELSVVSDRSSARSDYEILLGDTDRFDYTGRVMEYSVTVEKGVFRINVGGSCSAEKAIAYLCDHVFNGQVINLSGGEHFRNSLLTESGTLTSGATVRVMSANILADAFNKDTQYGTANYRAEILAGMLVSYTPDVVGMQEVDRSWYRALDSYLDKIEKTHGIAYSKYWATYENKTNYTSLLYRSDKLTVSNSGVKVFSWWKDLGADYNYHMRNISWAQFAFLENTEEKFIVANTHWSYRTEHDDGNTYLTGATRPIATNELRTQCKDETGAFMTSLRTSYDCPIFLTGDFNTSLSFFTNYSWTPAMFNVISKQAENNGTALSTVPTSGHYDHVFGYGSYTVRRFEILKDANQHALLTDHPFVYVDLEF